MFDSHGFFRAIAAGAVTALILGSALSSFGAAPASNSQGLHVHGNGKAHVHAPPIIGGPSTKKNDSLAEYFGKTEPYAGPTKGIGLRQGVSARRRSRARRRAADYESGRAAKGYFCNARLVSHFGKSGGYRVERYVDKAGTRVRLLGLDACCGRTTRRSKEPRGPGVYVMDMSNPAKPVHTDTLRTPAMQSPHESVRLNTKRGLLVADMGYPTWQPGFIDVFDVDGGLPAPRASSRRRRSASSGTRVASLPTARPSTSRRSTGTPLPRSTCTNPKAPTILWTTPDYQPHGVSVSNDGKRLYIAESAFDDERTATSPD